MLNYLIKINGYYDILCSLCILKIISIPILNNLHLSLFILKNNKITERFYAYWIFTYGIIRISNNYKLITYSYFIEALFITNELLNKTIIIDKSLFVILSSLLLSYLSYKKIN